MIPKLQNFAFFLCVSSLFFILVMSADAQSGILVEGDNSAFFATYLVNYELMSTEEGRSNFVGAVKQFGKVLEESSTISKVELFHSERSSGPSRRRTTINLRAPAPSSLTSLDMGSRLRPRRPISTSTFTRSITEPALTVETPLLLCSCLTC